MIRLNDQLGNEVSIKERARRIISIVPSQTEFLHYLCLEEEVVGITKFCVHPEEWFHGKERVGGTKTLDIEKIRSLQPDLIIGNKEENSQSDIEALQKEFTVYLSDIYTFEDALKMMLDVGVLTGKQDEAEKVVHELENQFDSFPKVNGTVLYFMWNKPYMVAGRNTFIGHVLERMGLSNAYTDPEGRYIEVSMEQIKEWDADYLLLSSEPFPFKQEHAEKLKTEVEGKVLTVDGEIFSWYGSRMLKMKVYLIDLFTAP